MNWADDRSKTSLDPRNTRGLQHVLGVTGININPDYVDMTEVKPVIDMCMSGYVRLNDYTNFLSATVTGNTLGIAGTTTLWHQILSTGNASGANPQIVVPVGLNFLLWGINAKVRFDAAGAAAYNTLTLYLYIRMRGPTSVLVTKWFEVFTVQTNRLEYSSLSLDRQKLCVIPAGSQLLLYVLAGDESTNFPANTYIRYELQGQAFPEGAPLPMGI